MKAENHSSYDFGNELDLFRNRIRLVTSLFRTKTTDLISPHWDGTTFSLINGSTLVRRGLEFDFTIRAISKNSFRWTVTGNYSRLRPTVEELPDGVSRIPLSGFSTVSTNLIAGQPYGVLYGSRYLRDDNGQLVIGDDGFPMVDAQPGVIGNPNPDWTMALDNQFTWKGLSLAILLDIRKGGDIWNGTQNTLNYLGVSQQTGDNRNVTGHVFQGVDQSGAPNEVAVDFYDPNEAVTQNRWTRYGFTGVAESAVQDASWFRIRSLSLTYQLPKTTISKLKLSKTSVTLYARNLLLLTRYSGVDPEAAFAGYASEGGLDYFNSPGVRSYGFSLKVGF